MPSRILGSQHPQSSESLPQPQPRPKKGLKSVLGFSRASSPEPRPSPAPTIATTASASAVSVTDPLTSGPARPRTLRERRSVDVVSGSGSFTASLSYRRKNARTREGRASVTDVSFFSPAGGPSNTPSTAEPDAAVTALTSSSTQQQYISAVSVPTTPTRPAHAVNLNSPEAKPRLNMATANVMPRIVNDIPQERTSRQKLARIKAQDGPWSVSVAESPYDKYSYSLYVKSTSFPACFICLSFPSFLSFFVTNMRIHGILCGL